MRIGSTFTHGTWHDKRLAMRTGLYPFFFIAAASATFGATPVQDAYIKASNSGRQDFFGHGVSLWEETLVVGAMAEDSGAVGINGSPNEAAPMSGAAYVFVRRGTNWTQQAFLKASNPGPGDDYGRNVAISTNSVIVAAQLESSDAVGMNGDGGNDNMPSSGAAYVYVRQGTNWLQQAYLKASNPGATNYFGHSVAIDGDTVVVGARMEGSQAFGSGAAYVFTRVGTNWIQQACLKASHAGSNDFFGASVAIDGNTIVVGANGESSSATGVSGNQGANDAPSAGAAYVFVRSGTNWSQQAYLKASNTGAGDQFGNAVSVAGDIVAVGAYREDSQGVGVDADQNGNDAPDSGAAYVFVREGTNWMQQAYIKASNTASNEWFGRSVDIYGDQILVGAPFEGSAGKGVNGSQFPKTIYRSGAAYLFVRNGTQWTQRAFFKSSNSDREDIFGFSVALGSGRAVIGASGESSSATGINGSQDDNSASTSGAAYSFSNVGSAARILTATLDHEGYHVLADGVPDSPYILERASNIAGPWLSNTTATASSSGVLEFRDPDALPPQRFFRVRKW